MPNRILRDTIKRSRTLANLSPEAFRHWTLCLTEADDHGCFECTPEVIAGACYPYARGTDPDKVRELTRELELAGVLKRWVDEDHEYALFTKWDKWNSYAVTDDGKQTRHRRRTPEPPTECTAVTCKEHKPRSMPAYATPSQDMPYPTPNPIPNPNPTPPPTPPADDMLPFEKEDIPERTGPVPSSSLLPVDYEPQKKAYLDRYAEYAATDPDCGYTPEQVLANLEDLFVDRRGKARPIRHVLNYLQDLAVFDAGQVIAAMDPYAKRERTGDEVGNPMSYFAKLAKEDAGHYQRKLEKKEIAADVQKSREAQRRAQTQPVDRSSTNAKPKPRHNDFQAVGDVLRALPTVRRACEIEKRDAANAPDEVPE